jgi:hypothetical protein
MADALGVPGLRERNVLARKYRTDRILGVGGMSVVVAAHHKIKSEHVARVSDVGQLESSPW